MLWFWVCDCVSTLLAAGAVGGRGPIGDSVRTAIVAARGCADNARGVEVLGSVKDTSSRWRQVLTGADSPDRLASSLQSHRALRDRIADDLDDP